MARKQILVLPLFVLFILQGTVVFWLTPSSPQLQIYPNFVLVCLFLYRFIIIATRGWCSDSYSACFTISCITAR